MRELPIIFSSAMVRAILSGTKTQTRRVMKRQPGDGWTPYGNFGEVHKLVGGEPDPEQVIGWGPCNEDGDEAYPCPYRIGMKIWVREACRAEELSNGMDGVRYLADDAFLPIDNTVEAGDAWLDLAWYGKRTGRVAEARNVPPIHMPRWASRITLEVTDVRVEHLHDISDEDSIAEGVYPTATGLYPGAAKAAYRRLWETIHGPDSWRANPWVWVVEFRSVP